VQTSTVGYEKRFNPAVLAATNEKKFVDYILSGQPEPPMYFARMKRVNKVGPSVLGRLPEPPQMSLDQLSRLDTRSVAIVDTRSWDRFRVGHVRGSLFFPFSKSFNTDAGSMIKETESIYLVIDQSDLEDAIRDLVRVGLDQINGWCPTSEFCGAKNLDQITEVSAEQAIPLVSSREVQPLDVRRRDEFVKGHIPGAINISHTRLASKTEEIPQHKRILINCHSGARSARAAAYLQRAGYDIMTLQGGMLAWERSDAPIEI
jgi:hydroxyacylglutathione hydrolase